ncbi:MAG: DUF2750 domain-containing protein, partial [Chitinophagaceae bacterium]
VTSTQLVWALASSEGFASMPSREFEETNVMPFWSNEADAAAMLQTGKVQYQPKSVTLSDFLENLLVGLHNENGLVGTEWVQNSIGEEKEPLQVAMDIANQLLTNKKELALKKYNNLEEFKTQIEKVVNED